MNQDALSDLLRCVRLRGVLFFHVECVGPWVTAAPSAAVLRPAIMPEAEHLMEYHVVLRGRCWAAVTGEEPVPADSGDIVVFPQGHAHVLSSAPGLRREPDTSLLLRGRPEQLPFTVLQHGDEPPRTIVGAVPPGIGGSGESAATLLCGFLGCDRGPFNPLLATLPPMIHARASGDAGWISQFAKAASVESRTKRPGGEAVLERLSEVMFVDVVRRYLDGLADDETGWLAGLRDRYVGRALGLLHARPADPWTLDGLSSAVGLSRSALHDRFVQLLDQPPMQYLTAWRMQLASRLLADSHAKLADIARQVGYESEAAFSRAFKRTAGLSPALWRREREAGFPATTDSRPDVAAS